VNYIRVGSLISAFFTLTLLVSELSAQPTMLGERSVGPNVTLTPERPVSEAEGPVATRALTPARELVEPAPSDPFVQKRNANAKANTEYRTSKQASKQELQATIKDARAKYREEVDNAKINRKGDRNAATNEWKSLQPVDAGH
jgi:hypothetical protein